MQPRSLGSFPTGSGLEPSRYVALRVVTELFSEERHSGQILAWVTQHETSGLLWTDYQSQSPVIDPEDAINLYCEKSESAGAKVPIAMLETPGSASACDRAGEFRAGRLQRERPRFCSRLEFLRAAGRGKRRESWKSGAAPLTPTQIIAKPGPASSF